MEPQLFETKKVDWQAFKRSVPAQLGRIYRGQPSSAWTLESTLRRAASATANLLLVEAELQFSYRQAVDNYLPPGQIPTCTVDWLASMQHHGAPTRLLDFTRSPYVAAYFAMEEATTETVVIWSFNLSWFQSRCEAILLGENPPNSHHLHPNLARWLYDEIALLPVSRMVAPAGCRRMSSRQLAQQAVFMLCGDLSVSFEENLLAMGTPGELSENITRFELEARHRGEVLEDLRLMNVNRMTLFPGLDGFAQSLKYKLAEDTGDRREMRALLYGLMLRPTPSGTTAKEEAPPITPKTHS